MKTETLHSLVADMDALRQQPGARDHLEVLLNLATRSGKIDSGDLSELAKIARDVTPEQMQRLVDLAGDSDPRSFLMKVAAAEDVAGFVGQLSRVLDGVSEAQSRDFVEMLRKSSKDNLHGIVQGLDALRSMLPVEGTFHALVDVIMTTKTNRVKTLEGLVDVVHALDPRGRRAVVALMGKMDKGEHHNFVDFLAIAHIAFGQVEARLLGEDTGSLLSLMLEAAVTQTQWIKFLGDALDFAYVLHDLPRTPENIDHITKILEHFTDVRGDAAKVGSIEAMMNNMDLAQLAADVSAAIKEIRNTSADPADMIKQQVGRLEGPGKNLAGQDAWLSHLETAGLEFATMIKDKDFEAFVGLLKKDGVLPGLSDGEYASLREMQKWFDKLAEIKGIAPDDLSAREALLKEVVDSGLGGARNKNLLKKGRFDDLARAFREATVRAEMALDAKPFDLGEALKQVGITEEQLSQRDDRDIIIKHLEGLHRQQEMYSRMLKMATDLDVSDAGMQQNVTEVMGELALTKHMLEHFPDFQLQQHFAKGTGFDQVWAIRGANGEIIRCIIGEAKGHKAKLGNPRKGPQMSPKWVMATIHEMMARPDPVGQLGRELRDLARRVKKGETSPDGEPLMEGVTTEAIPNSDPPPAFLPQEVVEFDIGRGGYEFSGVEIESDELIP